MRVGDPYRVLHTFEPEFGWHFTSPDVDGMVGGGASYADARRRSEYLISVHIAGKTGTLDDMNATGITVRFAHFVDEGAAGLSPVDNASPTHRQLT